MTIEDLVITISQLSQNFHDMQIQYTIKYNIFIIDGTPPRRKAANI